MPSPKLLSVNLGQPRPDGNRKAKTGIDKHPAEEAVFVGENGVTGDAVCNRKYHGGPDQAVYLYDAADSSWWAHELGREIPPGTFGENLTTEGVPMERLAIGDRLTVGAVELEVTAPRMPCATLGRHFGDPGIVKRFLTANRPGAYLRVIRSGRVAAGDLVAWTLYAGDRVGLIELYEDLRRPVRTEAAIRRILGAPLAERVRATKEAQLSSLKGRTQAGGQR